RRLGRDTDELVGLCPPDFLNHGLPLTLLESRQEWVREVVRTGKPVHFEDERGGTVFDTTMYPIPGAQGDVARLAIFARDVTAQREAERRAARAERLAAMGQLAAGLAHEMNNPLQAIRSNLELVRDFDLEPDEQESRLNVIHQEIERLAGLGQSVLDFARPSDDTRYRVSIAKLVDKTLALVGKQLQLAHIRVTTDFPADLPSLYAVPGQIAQVLLNLTINAIEAIGDGGHLHITAGVEGDVLALAVTDDGPPIPAKYMQHLFEPFFTTKTIGKGVGLGLSTVYGIVTQSAGALEITSAPHAGTTVKILLPVHSEESMPARLSAPPVSGRPAKGRVLVVEDDKNIRELSRLILLKKGFGVDVAEDGEEALALFNESVEGYDLVIADVVMPKMSGSELVESLRSRNKELKVIYISGYTGVPATQKLKLNSITAFLQKPFSPDMLLDTIRRLW
ncbi:MAG TPA: response regulator, partial [Spirochaetia bacterium]|nr:response regulator [Spirochaetia bacterium]